MTYVYRCPTCGRCNRPDVPVTTYCQHTGTIHDAKRQATMVRVWENESPEQSEPGTASTAPALVQTARRSRR